MKSETYAKLNRTSRISSTIQYPQHIHKLLLVHPTTTVSGDKSAHRNSQTRAAAAEIWCGRVHDSARSGSFTFSRFGKLSALHLPRSSRHGNIALANWYEISMAGVQEAIGSDYT